MIFHLILAVASGQDINLRIDKYLAGKIKDGEKVVITASKQGLKFNGELAAAA